MVPHQPRPAQGGSGGAGCTSDVTPLLWAACALPAFLALACAGALSTRRRRQLAIAAAAGLALWALPWGGLTLDDLKRGQFLLASAFALLLAARRAGLAALTPARERAALAVRT